MSARCLKAAVLLFNLFSFAVSLCEILLDDGLPHLNSDFSLKTSNWKITWSWSWSLQGPPLAHISQKRSCIITVYVIYCFKGLNRHSWPYGLLMSRDAQVQRATQLVDLSGWAMCQKTLLGVVVVCLVLSDRNPINIHWHVRSGSCTRAVICVWIDTDMYNISRWAIVKCKRCYLKWGPRSLKLVVFSFHYIRKCGKLRLVIVKSIL